MTVLQIARRISAAGCVWCLATFNGFAATDPAIPPTAEQLAFFEKKIRPVLVQKCYKCHATESEKVKGGLLLDTRDGIRAGGDTGHAVVPGRPAESLILNAMRGEKKMEPMPPKETLAAEVIGDFEKWISMGAPDPRDGGSRPVAKKSVDVEAGKNFWAFKAPQAEPVPKVKNTSWPRTDTDRFLLAALEARGLKPVGDADKPALLRRVYFDLIGLPPTPEEARSFLDDRDPKAFEKVVDRLLASPQFGERWGRHWMDVARYAESSGKDVNVTFPHAWRYRDYVIASFNKDKPYDRFIREQIAGDLLPVKDEVERADNLIATGFLAIGAKSLNETNPRQFAVDLADEQIDTVSQAMLGLTVACARCHDHKFDPVSQREYTALSGIFLSTETRFGTPGGVQARNASTLIELPSAADLPVAGRGMPAAERRAKEDQLARLRDQQKEALAERAGGKGGKGGQKGKKGGATSSLTGFDIVRIITRAQQLETELAGCNPDGTPRTLAMGVLEKPLVAGTGGTTLASRTGPLMTPGGPGRRSSGFETIGDSPLLARGDIEKAGEKIPRGFPGIISNGKAPTIPHDQSGRLQLASWLASQENPLTARVMANRVWHWLFGRGLVASVDNFGTTGRPPSNQALLDFLAARFVGDGWSVKKLIRGIVLSRAYQLDVVHVEVNFAADPDNALFWRMNPRRLDAEAIRDAMLYAAGALDPRPQTGSLIARAGDGPIGGERFMALGEEAIAKAGGEFRSIYLPVTRNVLPEVLAVFDFPDPSMIAGLRETTSVPSQSLHLLNSDFVAKQSERLAARLLAVHPGAVEAGFDRRFELASWLVLARPPNESERAAASTFLAKSAKGDPKSVWISICRALFASADFRYLN